MLPSAGTNIKVQIEEFSSEGKKLVLSMSFENRADVGALSGISSSKWLNGVVQSVSPFGIFVRPAGYEMTGYLVHCCMSINNVFCTQHSFILLPVLPTKATTWTSFSAIQ
jgi:ribosomal protein S1